ncbi:MAG TPA: hypothetical protein VD886_09060 [Herpetosiphonaceae bacterium]|nr:hypothetical protein [Herpetosiphonaceae bacterium]
MTWLTRPEPMMVVGAVACAITLFGEPMMSRTIIGGLCFGLFLVLKGCQELAQDRHPRLARVCLALSLGAMVGWFLDGILWIV